MSAIKKAGMLYESNKTPDYAPETTLIRRVAFTLTEIDGLMQMFIHDHVLPVAKKLGYEVKQKEGYTEFDYAGGYHKFRRIIELRKKDFPKKNDKLSIFVEPGKVEVDYQRTREHQGSNVSIDLGNPTFSLIKKIEEFEKGN